ncbi:uncharacterized protein EHS24_000679 [Apiotrichum porosum]|uniref:Mitochondrial zinc maintenance protein 1, mitochondrial n=1 Tax=Apiotrichum porosum TaxID=105984 RepID=A0A427YAM5_9TREE|nr:uncharacterized protein EHS24_000679 [Apiotrichum porosum]RSH88152.1 hypothetical protein EHS24_000679 [Apiotrichum porosum]
MAIPSTLLPAARSAYRNVLRSARATFHNDPPRHAAMVVAVRETFASPTLTRPGAELPPPTLNEATGEPIVVDLSSPEELQKRINEWNEVATFLRRNVVQGRQDDQGVYKLRVTKDTDLGDNDTIKEPAVMPVTPFPNRGKRRAKKCGE